ncbi:restriction endonuclease subunit S [Synechococcus sp. CS-1329]|uniref:restriction endonuclease subunit S n=1 Tax=Synechococcus sp. CS-1329 TaxID=2847975 RepID=UPI00223AB75C|nr:restriction endonuclease subunit S [Synechococcus sp. CS-1329]MCT0218473.1 restriction endonuclease subunit S [Synechococcus sp. CS-1329]
MNKRGATIKGITRDCLEQIRLNIPPLAEQKKIAHILSTVQRAIQAQERIIQTTTELKKALMHKLFNEGLRGEPQKQTEIGPVPESWEVRKLGDIATTISKGSSPKWQGFHYTDKGILFVRSQNVGSGRMLLDDRTYLPPSFNEKEKRSILQSGDILINLVGASIGRVALGTDDIEGGNCNQAVGFVRLERSEAIKQLIVYFLLSPWGQEQMRRQKKDIARANLSLLDVRGFEIPIPPVEDEIEEIARALVTLDKKNATHERKRDQLQNLFRTLLHELMTAKIRVHDLPLTVG